MKNNMCPKMSLSATIDGKRSRGRQHRAVRDSLVERVNVTMPNFGKDDRIDRWMMHSKGASDCEHAVKITVLRDRPSASSTNEENDDD